MKIYLFNKNGSIAMCSFMISIILITVLVSTLTVFMHDYYAVQSSMDSIRAYYLAEIATEKALYEIKGTTDSIITKYLTKLKEYKIHYINNIIKGDNIEEYKPPELDEYLKELVESSSCITENNPFSNYLCDHFYTANITYDLANKKIDIVSKGVYNGARKFIHATIRFPIVCDDGIDEYNMPMKKVIPLQLESYYQTIGQ
ncbi:hypothetical protein FQB35_06975 [Crassaminicella thermophila]|uniref:PilX N-terminal n=1 Tax=Crassaminicella thermophila TaxID=2599308 RepID=A0A5C0SED2_CRATE|nr:hypothetical protein [Crassaminicella thermophila]QEK12136.1 hypothetical protein FQB35_06975 [Crassaminicella thermophila]